MSANDRYELRQKESKPLLESFKKWLDDSLQTVLPQSPLGKAINYCQNRWTRLIQFLDDGRLDIDNNITEQKIKPIVIARKNFLLLLQLQAQKHYACILVLFKQLKCMDMILIITISSFLKNCQTVRQWRTMKSSCLGI